MFGTKKKIEKIFPDAPKVDSKDLRAKIANLEKKINRKF
jgi:hypothetical protein